MTSWNSPDEGRDQPFCIQPLDADSPAGGGPPRARGRIDPLAEAAAFHETTHGRRFVSRRREKVHPVRQTAPGDGFCRARAGLFLPRFARVRLPPRGAQPADQPAAAAEPGGRRALPENRIGSCSRFVLRMQSSPTSLNAMWIVRLALRRPYTFTVVALLILIMGTLSATAHGEGHLPPDRHPHRQRHLAVHRPDPGRDGEADDPDFRTRDDDDGERHRAHRIPVAPGRRRDQGLLLSGHQHGHPRSPRSRQSARPR